MYDIISKTSVKAYNNKQMIYNFNCILKGISFKYKVEAENITEAKVKVREHIKNAVLIDLVVQETMNKASEDFIDFFNDIIKQKKP